MSIFKDFSINNLLGIESSGEKRKDFLQDRKVGEFEDYSEKFGDQATRFNQMSEDFFNPNSALNNQRFGILNEAIQDQTASGIRDYQAAMAQQGMNVGASGVGAQNMLQARRRAGGDAASAMNKAYLDSFGLGMNAAKFGSNQQQLSMGAMGQADQIYAGANAAKMQQDSINAQKRAGLMQTVAGGAMNMLAPGVSSLMGGVMAGEGLNMSNFAKPYANAYNNRNEIQSKFSGLLNYATGGYNEPSASSINRYDNRGGMSSGSSASMNMPGMPNFSMNTNFATAFSRMPQAPIQQPVPPMLARPDYDTNMLYDTRLDDNQNFYQLFGPQ